MGIQINGSNDNISSTDGSLTVTGYQLSGATNINTTGIITASTANFTGNVSIAGTLTYEDVTSVDSVGIITAQSDVSIADKIIHTGDTNTAIRFPAADTFTVETGGSERIRVDSSGKILAGSTSSREVAGGEAKIQVEATNSEGISLIRTSADSGAVYLSLGKTRNGSVCQAGDTIGAISWNPDDGTDLNHPSAEILTLVGTGIGNNDVPGDLVFKTNGGTSTTTERLRIASAGQIGLGGANYGTSGQVMTSNGSGSAPTWQDASGGGPDPVIMGMIF